MVYEMATGHKAFEGESQASLITAIMSSEPEPISTLAPMTPQTLDHVVRRCLAKDPDDRVQTARDVTLELEWAKEGRSEAIGSVSATLPPPAFWKRATPWVLAMLMAVMAGLALWGPWRERAPSPQTVTRFTLNLPPTERLWFGERFERSIALSPDGTQLVYVASRGGSQQLYLHKMDQFFDAGPIRDTEDARSPFFSHDGESVAFLTSGKLKKVLLSSGAVTTLCDTLPVSSGGSWGADGYIIFKPGVRATESGLDGLGFTGILSIPSWNSNSTLGKVSATSGSTGWTSNEPKRSGTILTAWRSQPRPKMSPAPS